MLASVDLAAMAYRHSGSDLRDFAASGKLFVSIFFF